MVYAQKQKEKQKDKEEKQALKEKDDKRLKVATQLGSIEHLEWGWSSYEARRTRTQWFRRWDGLIAALATFQFTLISYQAAFDPYDSNLMRTTYMLDMCNVVDVCISVLKGYETDRQNVELRKGNSKLMEYIQSWFLIDIVGLLPFEVLLVLLGATVKVDLNLAVMAFARTNRLLCGYKIFLFLGEMEAEVGALFIVIRGVYYTVLSWLMMHLTACIWYMLPCSHWSDIRDGINICTAPSWIYSGGSTTSTVSTFANLSGIAANRDIYPGAFDHGLGQDTGSQEYVRIVATTGQRYFSSLYWTITTTTSVGLGDTHAITLPEMVFVVLAQLLGMIVLFGIIQGSITSMLTNFDQIQFRYKHRIDAIIHYLRDQNQSTELVRNVTDFYAYLWKRSSGMSSSGLFDQLPFPLRSEIAMELSGQIIDKSPLFQDISASFLRMLCLKFRPLLVLPEQIIMKKGELSDLMVYIQNGELEVLSDDETEVPVLLLRPGKLFGEINLITRMPRKYSIRAIGHCDLVVLRTEDLMDCLQSYPEIADELRQRAEERTGLAQQKVVEGLLAHSDNNEATKRKKQQKELAAKVEELQQEMGVCLRPLMTALNIDRPQKTLKVSKSVEIFKICDPMDEMVKYKMGAYSRRVLSRYRRVQQMLFDLSIDPDGLFYYFWERTIIGMAITSFFLNSYIGFFHSYSDMLSQDSTKNACISVLFFSYVMDLFFIADYGLKFVTQIVTANGKITDHRSMAMKYILSWGCYTDFVAIFPIEVFAAGLGDFFNSLGYLKLNRTVRILNLPRFFDHLSSDLGSSTSLVRGVKFTLYIAISTQLSAVLLFLTACTPQGCSLDDKTSWTAPTPPNITAYSAHDYRFTSALYFAVELMSTAGYGDIFSHNVVEQLVANLVMMIGILVYGYCLAVLTATIANLDAPRVEFQDRLFAMINFMEYNKLASSVQKRAIDSVALLWTISKGEEIPGVKNMIHDMPEHLMEEIQVDDLIHLVAGVPIFKNIEEHILKSFAPAVHRYLFPPGEFIIQSGDLIDELFVIRRGFCSMFHPDDNTICIGILHPGMYFGEIGFLFNRNEIISVKTITYCEVLTLPRWMFDRLVVSVEWLQVQMNRISEDRRYYGDLVYAAKHAKPYTRKRGQHQPPARLSEQEKQQLRFREDLRAVHVPFIGRCFYRLLLSRTIPMDSKFLLIWEWVRLVESAVLFFLTLTEVAFQFDNFLLSLTLRLCDVYAAVDIYVKFHVQYSNDMNIPVRHPYMTAKRYLNSSFWLDLVAAFPFELFLLFVARDSSSEEDNEIYHWIMYCQLNRLLQIYRIPLAFSFMESDIKRDTSSLFLIKYCIYFILFVTFIMCMPLVIECPPLACGVTTRGCRFKPEVATRSDLDIALDIQLPSQTTRRPGSFESELLELEPDHRDKWFKSFRTKRDTDDDFSIGNGYFVIDPEGYVNLDNTSTCIDNLYLSLVGINSSTSHWAQFITGMYWAITTSTTTGFGDIFAKNQAEQIIFLGVMVAGSVFYGYIVACVSAAQANSDARRSKFFERLVAVKQYLQHERLHKTLQKRVLRYYEYLWLRTKGIDPQTLIVGLPPSLTGELALQLYKKVIEQTPIFKKTPTGFKKMLAAIIKPLYIMEGEYITRIGDIGSDLFFLYRGSVEEQYPNGDINQSVVKAGRIIGEVAFLTNQKAQISYRARENSDIYYITKHEFDLVLDHFPEVRDRLMEEAEEGLERDNEHMRLFEQRPHKQTLQSIAQAVQAEAKYPLRERLKRMKNYVFEPDDKFIRYFGKFTVNALRVLSCMLIMYQAAFSWFTASGFFITYILEALFLMDVFLQFRIGYLDQFGNQVLDRLLIRKRYVQSRSGLLVDVLTCFPYEICGLAAPSELQSVVTCYFMYLRLPARLFRIYQFFNNWLAELDINVLLVRLAYSFTQLWLWLHFFTCVAYIIGTHETGSSWVSLTMLQQWIQDSTVEPSSAYVITLYWIGNTATSTGYGDIYAPTNIDRIFSSFVQVVGKSLFGFIIGDISSALANAEISRQLFESQFHTIKSYLLDQKANKPIIDRVQNYFNYLWNINRGITDINTVLNDAPFCLRTEISYSVHNKDLRQLALFREASDAFIRMLSACLHQVQFVPGDYIIQQGDLVQEMYFLHRGEAVEVETGVEIGVIRHGNHINWQAILIDWPASRTVRATDNCEVYVLSRPNLEMVVSRFHAEMDYICTTNRIRLRDLLEEEHIDLD